MFLSFLKQKKWIDQLNLGWTVATKSPFHAFGCRMCGSVFSSKTLLPRASSMLGSTCKGTKYLTALYCRWVPYRRWLTKGKYLECQWQRFLIPNSKELRTEVQSVLMIRCLSLNLICQIVDDELTWEELFDGPSDASRTGPHHADGED